MRSFKKPSGLTLVQIVALAGLLATACGCMSDQQWADTKEMHRNYMAQERSYRAVALSGTNMNITITGASELVLEAPLNPLTTIPQAPDVLKDTVDGIKTVAGYGALSYVGAKAVNGLTEDKGVCTEASGE